MLENLKKYKKEYNNLHLNGLTTIDTETAKNLSWFRGGDIYLN